VSNFLVGDLLAAISVGSARRKIKIVSSSNKLGSIILKVFLELGYIRGFSLIKFGSIKKQLVYLKYAFSRASIRRAFAISTPGDKCYMKHRNIFGGSINNNVSSGGFIVLSTSRGLLTDLEAFMVGTGGEVMLFIG
jgi:small subunit ribosomal protein S8